MVRLVTQAPEPAKTAAAAPAQSAALDFSGLADIGTILSQQAAAKPNPISQAKFEQDLMQRRAIADFAGEQIDLALEGLSGTDIEAIAQADRAAGKLESLRVQNPAASKDSYMRIRHARKFIGDNPLTAPEILSTFGLVNEGSIGDELGGLYDEVDRQNRELVENISAYRTKYGFHSQTDAEIIGMMEHDGHIARRSDVAANRYNAIENEMKTRWGDLIEQEYVAGLHRGLAEDTDFMTLRREKQALFLDEGRQGAYTEMTRRAREIVANFDPTNPNANKQSLDATFFELEQMFQDYQQEARMSLGGLAPESYIVEQGAGLRGLIDTLKAYTSGDLSKAQAENALNYAQSAIILKQMDETPGFAESFVLLTKLGPLFENSFIETQKLTGPLMPSIQLALSKIGESNRLGGVGGGDTDLVSMLEGRGMSTAQAHTVLREQSQFLAKWAQQGVDKEDIPMFQDIVRATFASADGNSKLLNDDKLVQAMDSILPILSSEEAIKMIPEDVADQFALNTQVYSQAFAGSIANDLSEILGAQVNVQQIPRYLGMADQLIPEVRDFVDVTAGVEGVSVTPNYQLKIGENGDAVLLKDGRTLPVRSTSALNQVDRAANNWLQTWNSTYRPKIKVLSNYLSTAFPGWTPEETAQLLISGKTPFDVTRAKPETKSE